MIPAQFDYLAPESIEEALSLLSQHGDDAKLLAGGQSLFPMMKLRLAAPSYLIDLGRVPGLTGINTPEVAQEAATTPLGAGGPFLTIGAMTRYYEIEDSSLVRSSCPLLAQTAAVVADVQVRNQGTIGGSLAHADPTGDMPAAVLALGAELKAVGSGGERWVRSEDFFTGFFTTELADDEILSEVRVPVLDGWTSSYLKAAPRAAGFAVAGVAVCLRTRPDRSCDEIRIAVTGVTDKPYRAYDVEDALRGQRLDDSRIDDAVRIVTDGLWIADDVRASAAYRAHLAQVYTGRAVRAAREVAPIA